MKNLINSYQVFIYDEITKYVSSYGADNMAKYGFRFDKDFDIKNLSSFEEVLNYLGVCDNLQDLHDIHTMLYVAVKLIEERYHVFINTLIRALKQSAIGMQEYEIACIIRDYEKTFWKLKSKEDIDNTLDRLHEYVIRTENKELNSAFDLAMNHRFNFYKKSVDVE